MIQKWWRWVVRPNQSAATLRFLADGFSNTFFMPAACFVRNLALNGVGVAHTPWWSVVSSAVRWVHLDRLALPKFFT